MLLALLVILGRCLMPLFKYVAVDEKGIRFKDQVEKGSEGEAAAFLVKLGLVPLRVRAVKAVSFRPTLSYRALGELCGALSVAFEAELNPRAALDSLHSWSGLARARALLSPALDRGLSLSQAFISNPKAPPLIGTACLAGERNGKLPETLAALSEYLDALADLEEKISKAKFACLFALIACALLIPLFLGKAMAVTALSIWIVISSFPYFIKIYVPILGRLARSASTHSLCQGVRLFKSAGLELHEALALCASAEKDKPLGRALMKVAEAVEDGRPAWPLLEGYCFDIVAVKAMANSERKGCLIDVCLKLAQEQKRKAFRILEKSVTAVCASAGVAILGAAAVLIFC
jgi:type II secretory pathway component PulF